MLVQIKSYLHVVQSSLRLTQFIPQFGPTFRISIKRNLPKIYTHTHTQNNNKNKVEVLRNRKLFFSHLWL